jgi:hypothetical protein
MSRRRLWLIVPLFVLAHSAPSFALPTMIRIGYNNCAACHLSPQGGGLLTPYGKGVDMAQSLKGGEKNTAEEQRRLLYDVRFVMGANMVTAPSQASVRSSNFRFMLRSAYNISAHTRISYQAGLETPSLARTVSASTPRSADFVVSKALFEYHPREGIDIAIGRDTLPTGLGLPDPQTFQRRQHDPLGTGYPTQIKAFLWTNRFQFTPYVFGPGFDETRVAQQHGGGVLGGVDVWKQRAVIGMSARQSSADAFDRRSIGAYARLGFGRWGILAEHDLTTRVTNRTVTPRSEYVVGFTQLFAAPVEWFVTSLAVDDVKVTGTGAKHAYRFAPTAQMRISENLTMVFSTRDEFVSALVPHSRTYAVTFAVKTVQ